MASLKQRLLPALVLVVALALIVSVLDAKGNISIGGSYDGDYAKIVATLKESNYDDAAARLESFIQRYGEDPLALNNLAVIQVRQGLFDEADALFTRAEKSAADVMIPKSVRTAAFKNKNGNLEIFHTAFSAAEGKAAYGDMPVETMEISGLIKFNIMSAND